MTLLWAAPRISEAYGLPQFDADDSEWRALMEPALKNWTWCDAVYSESVGTLTPYLGCTRAAHSDGIHIATGGGEFYLAWRD